MVQAEAYDIARELSCLARKELGSSLQAVVLYGSCARGDYSPDSDIDILLLVDAGNLSLSDARRRVSRIASRIGLERDVVVSPVVVSRDAYESGLAVSGFFQSVEKEGRRVA